MWTTIHVAYSRSEAERIKATLIHNGILVSWRNTAMSAGVTGNRVHIDIMVPERQVKETTELLHWVQNTMEG